MVIMAGITKRILQYIACIAIVLSLIISGVSAFSAFIAPTNAAASSDLSDQTVSDASQCSVPTKIILVRHGQTSWNALGLLQGNADVPLDENGTAQTSSSFLF